MKKVKKTFYDPYSEVIADFNFKGVGYVIIGMSGINYYASKAQETFATQDFDVFLKPTIENVKKAVTVLQGMGYSVNTAGGAVDAGNIKNIVGFKRTILAVDHHGITIELLLEISGYTFNQIEDDAVTFKVNKVPLKVGRLTKLLRSKQIAARDKDKLFLKRFEMLIKESKF
jgi:predicted nucleotidyltransferase